MDDYYKINPVTPFYLNYCQQWLHGKQRSHEKLTTVVGSLNLASATSTVF